MVLAQDEGVKSSLSTGQLTLYARDNTLLAAPVKTLESWEPHAERLVRVAGAPPHVTFVHGMGVALEAAGGYELDSVMVLLRRFQRTRELLAQGGMDAGNTVFFPAEARIMAALVSFKDLRDSAQVRIVDGFDHSSFVEHVGSHMRHFYVLADYEHEVVSDPTELLQVDFASGRLIRPSDSAPVLSVSTRKWDACAWSRTGALASLQGSVAAVVWVEWHVSGTGADAGAPTPPVLVNAAPALCVAGDVDPALGPATVCFLSDAATALAQTGGSASHTGVAVRVAVDESQGRLRLDIDEHVAVA